MQKLRGATQIFMQIVQIDSPSGYETRMSDYVFDCLQNLGIKAIKDKIGNVIGFVPGDPNKEPFILNAHLDTVEPGRNIKPKIIDDDRIVSSEETILGADNKSSVAVILEVLMNLSKDGFKTNNPLEVVFTVSEESGNLGAHGLDYSKLRSKRGWSSDASNYNLGDLIVSSPFYNRFDIQIKGLAAHASKPELAKNVILIFKKAISSLDLGRIDEETLVNIGIVQCGQVVNTIPGEMIVSGEVRSFSESKLEQETKKVCSTFEQAAKSMQAVAKCKVDRENGGFIVNKTGELVKKTKETLKKFKIKSNFIKSWGCYDANIFAQHGIEVLNIADGSKYSHTKDETVKISDLDQMVKIFLDLIR